MLNVRSQQRSEQLFKYVIICHLNASWSWCDDWNKNIELKRWKILTVCYIEFWFKSIYLYVE